MEIISDDARRYLLHQRLARRWIREGGVVIATEPARAGMRSTFDFAETVTSGATLQVTFNLREVSKACRFLNDYAIYLWNCDREGEYLLCGLGKGDAHAIDVGGGALRAPRPLRRVAPTCYAGSYPELRLDIYDTEMDATADMHAVFMSRMLLPRGLCAAIYQPAHSAPRKRCAGPFDLDLDEGDRVIRSTSSSRCNQS